MRKSHAHSFPDRLKQRRRAHESTGTVRRAGSCDARVQAGAEPHARVVLELCGRLLIHLHPDRHVPDRGSRFRVRRSCLHLGLADRLPRPDDRRSAVLGARGSLSAGRLRVPVVEEAGGQAVGLEHRLDLSLRADRDDSRGCAGLAGDPAADLGQVPDRRLHGRRGGRPDQELRLPGSRVRQERVHPRRSDGHSHDDREPARGQASSRRSTTSA